MDNFEDLSLRIEKFIEEEKDRNPDIKYLNKTHAKLITQIISNYKLSEKNDSENIPTFLSHYKTSFTNIFYNIM